MTPLERDRRAHIWEAIENAMFRPKRTSGMKDWCFCYIRSLPLLWETQHPAANSPFPHAVITLPFPNCQFEYNLSEAPLKSSITIRSNHVDIVSHDIDHDYDERISLYEPLQNGVLSFYPAKSSRSSDVRRDICWVLDRYLFHPCAHIHPGNGVSSSIVSPTNHELDCLHEMRLAAGMTNPFAALFQYRVGLVYRGNVALIKQAKEDERNRLADLALNEILKSSGIPKIPPGTLFGLGR